MPQSIWSFLLGLHLCGYRPDPFNGDADDIRFAGHVSPTVWAMDHWRRWIDNKDAAQ